MRSKLPFTFVLLAAAFAAHVQAEEPAFVFADFGKNPSTTNQGADLTQSVYSERKGDAVVHSISVVGETAIVMGEIGNKKGSQFAGAGVMMTHGGATAKDLSAYKNLRIKMASPTADYLRLRITGDDTKILNIGCYPVYTQKVTPTLTEYNITLINFKPELYCGENARPIENTLKKAMFVELMDTGHTRNKPTQIFVGKIEFTP